MPRSWKVITGIGYYPKGVDSTDPEAERVSAEPGEVISDITDEDAEGLGFYGVLEEMVAPKVKVAKDKDKEAEA